MAKVSFPSIEDVRSEPPSHDGVSNLGHPRLLSWRGCRTSWSSTPFPKGAVEVVECEVGHFHAMLAIDGESSNNLEQPEELGREAIVADLELTEVHEEDTEKHPGVGELDLSVGVHAPGEVRKTHMCLRTLLSRRWQPHHVGMPVDILKLLIHQLTQLLQGISL